MKDRYVTMAERGETLTTGESTVQVGPWLRQVWDDLVLDADVRAMVCDRYRQAELLDALAASRHSGFPLSFAGRASATVGRTWKASARQSLTVRCKARRPCCCALLRLTQSSWWTRP